MKRVVKFLISMVPLMVVGGLLYAGLFIRPEPAGSSVLKPIFERGDSFYGIALPSADAFWAAGSGGKIVHSTDQGKSWTLQPTPVNDTLQDIEAWDSARAVAAGNDGVVLTTKDGGRSWQEVEVPRSDIANKFVRVRTMPGGVAWVVGAGGMALRSNDFGMTWESTAEQEDISWNDIFFVGRRGWLVGEFGNLRVSDDGGDSWQAVDSPVEDSLMAIAFRDSRHGVAVGMSGLVMTTSDGGKQWTVRPPVTAEHLFDVTWNGTRWIAAGGDGVVLTAGNNARAWNAARSSQQTRRWYTEVQHHEDGYYLAGDTLAWVENGTLNILSH